MSVVEYPIMLTNLVAGLLIIGFGIIVGNIASIITKKALESFEVDRLFQLMGARFPIEEFVSSLIKYSIYLIGLVWGLTFLGLDQVVLYTVLFILLVLLVLFVLLAIKDFIPNFVAGVIIHFTKKIKKGDLISMDSAEGKVTNLSMLEAKIKMKDGDIVIIPHTLLAKNKVVKKKKKKKM